MIVELPIEIKGLLSYLITQGLKALWNLFGKDFSGGAAAFAAVLVGAVLFFLEGLLGLIPDAQVELVNAVLGLIVLVLSSFGIHYTYRNLRG